MESPSLIVRLRVGVDTPVEGSGEVELSKLGDSSEVDVSGNSLWITLGSSNCFGDEDARGLLAKGDDSAITSCTAGAGNKREGGRWLGLRGAGMSSIGERASTFVSELGVDFFVEESEL